MSRVADYAIQGFLYQFNKTLIEILKAENDIEITVEGIIEDVDITFADGSIEAIQCKYHESKDRYTPSLIFKPLLQMMRHYASKETQGVRYRLFIHVPNESSLSRNVELSEIDDALQSQSYTELIGEINGHGIDRTKFSEVCELEFGGSLDELRKDAIKAFEATHLSKDSIETLFYPNAINEIANISIKHDESDRKVRHIDFLSKLEAIRTTAISRWTLALKTFNKILESRRKQLKPNLDKNSRNRCFIISSQSVQNFDSQIILFIQDYINKYHFKPNHDKPPTFYFDCDDELFKQIQQRLYDKGIKFATGEIAGNFKREHFYRDPIIQQVNRSQISSDFQIRVTTHNVGKGALDHRAFDDIYIVSEQEYTFWEQDVEIEYLPLKEFSHLKFILGLSNVIE